MCCSETWRTRARWGRVSCCAGAIRAGGCRESWSARCPSWIRWCPAAWRTCPTIWPTFPSSAPPSPTAWCAPGLPDSAIDHFCEESTRFRCMPHLAGNLLLQTHGGPLACSIPGLNTSSAADTANRKHKSGVQKWLCAPTGDLLVQLHGAPLVHALCLMLLLGSICRGFEALGNET